MSEEDHYEYYFIKRAKAYENRYLAIAYTDYGIPKDCPCGSPIIIEQTDEPHPLGKRYFACTKYKEDPMIHRRKYWDTGVEEELERLHKQVEEHEKRWRNIAMDLSSLTVKFNRFLYGEGGILGFLNRDGGGDVGAGGSHGGGGDDDRWRILFP